MQYAVQIQQEGKAFLVSCRDLPEMNSVGDSLNEALAEAVDGIESVFMLYMEDRRAIPAPSAIQQGEHWVRLPARVAAKVALYNEMVAQKVTKAELARRLSWKQTQVDRLWSLNHSTKLESIEAAFHAVGRQLEVVIA